MIRNPYFYDPDSRAKYDSFRSLYKKKTGVNVDVPSAYQLVPCGKCVGCLKHKTSATVGMLIAESQSFNGHAYFVTLTIDECHSDNCVHKDHLNSLINAINKSNKRKGTDYKYYITSEYGSHTLRPHYHGIFFGFKNMETLGMFLDKYWSFGHITLSDTNPARFNYTANAHINKCSQVPIVDWYDEDSGEVFSLPATECFIRQSRNLAKAYVYKHAYQIDRDSCLKFNGRQYPLHPKFSKYLADALGMTEEFHSFLKSLSPRDTISMLAPRAKKYGFILRDYNDVQAFLSYYEKHYRRLEEKLYYNKYIVKDNSHNNLLKSV